MTIVIREGRGPFYIGVMINTNDCYWDLPVDELLSKLSGGSEGLSQEEAERRLALSGADVLKPQRRTGSFFLFLRQFKSPITLLLVGAALLSFIFSGKSDAFIIIAIIVISALLGFYQEKGAAGALSKLMQLVQVRTTVLRDGQPTTIEPERVVPGDVVLLEAGEMVPGDCRLLQSKELFANEASLTGETFPVEKRCGNLSYAAALSERGNCLFMGTHVISGTGKGVVVRTGVHTEFGAISQHLRHLQPETAFERGIRRFGYLLLEVTLMLLMIIFSINVFLHKPVLDSFLFALAIAVGLTPQLLPAIISINLAKGASNMAKRSVIVKRLSAIENFGSMDVLCCDKTGTITTGDIVLARAIDASGKDSEKVFRYAYINAFFEQGFSNPIDQAIRKYGKPAIGGVKKMDELPYDFIRRRLSLLVRDGEGGVLVTKGAFDKVLSVCAWVDGDDVAPISPVREEIIGRFRELSSQGYRILGVAYRKMAVGLEKADSADETDMIFAGMLLLTDPPKKDIRESLEELEGLGIGVKIITGDNGLIAANVAKQVGLMEERLMTGEQIRDMNVEALSRVAGGVQVFAAVEPNQKEKILLALKKAGYVTGFLGDGINDASALHVADVGISVNNAADVAKDAADIVLLGNDLKVLAEGVREGRRTFANTLKYIFIATSANFGNMFSMAGASLFLSFLPLLPKQVLLINLLTDIPEMTIATDTVDSSMIAKPRRIDLHFVGRFMVVFGLISSIYDYATFGALYYWLKAGSSEFRTGWFLESVVSASLIVLVVRTSRAFYRNLPGKYLLICTLAIIAVTIVLPFTPLAPLLGFVPLPLPFFGVLFVILVLYILTAEIAKRIFYHREGKY